MGKVARAPSRLQRPCPVGPVETIVWDGMPAHLCILGKNCVTVRPGDAVTGQMFEMNGDEFMMIYSHKPAMAH